MPRRRSLSSPVALLIGTLAIAAIGLWAVAARPTWSPAAVSAILLVLLMATAAAFLKDRRESRALARLTARAQTIAAGKLDAIEGPEDLTPATEALGSALEAIRALVAEHRNAVAEHRAVMDEIVDSLREGLVAIDSQARVLVANRRVARMFEGSSAVDMVGRPLLEAIRHRTVDVALQNALAGNASVERVALGSGDGERHIEVRAFPVESATDIAAVALFIDMTAIERLQRIRRDFLDDFSHEVRTPLAGLRSASETIEHGGLTRESELQLRQIMHRQILRIERLVDQLSELNQIESGQLVLQRWNVDLQQMLGDLRDDFQARHESARLTLQGTSVHVSIDPARGQQIFSNLLDNAFKHGGGRGVISITVERRGEAAAVTVSDEGPGIPPHEIDRIFNRFYRVDRSRSQPGTGLGLAIAKHLVLAHGGAIRAYNRPEGGASFEVTFPAAAES